MDQKRGFLNLLKKIVINFHWICSVMKSYIISCVPAQIPYLGKFWFLRYRAKCSQSIRLQDFLINHIFRMNQWNSLIFCMLIQIYINQKLIKNLWVGMVRNGCGPPGRRTLKLAVSQKWIDGMNLFLYAGANSGVGLVKNGPGHLVHETLKSAKWVYGLSWFFACWHDAIIFG